MGWLFHFATEVYCLFEQTHTHTRAHIHTKACWIDKRILAGLLSNQADNVSISENLNVVFFDVVFEWHSLSHPWWVCLVRSIPMYNRIAGHTCIHTKQHVHTLAYSPSLWFTDEFQHDERGISMILYCL